MGYYDGKSFFTLDFGLHGEKGENKNKPYGLKHKQVEKRYNKRFDKGIKCKKRVDDYF